MQDCTADLDHEALTTIRCSAVDHERVTPEFIVTVIPSWREDNSHCRVVHDIATCRSPYARAIEMTFPQVDLNCDDMSAGRRHRNHIGERTPKDVLFDRIRSDGYRHDLNVGADRPDSANRMAGTGMPIKPTCFVGIY